MDKSTDAEIIATLRAPLAEVTRGRDEQSPDTNVESVRAMLLERSKVGLAKYGVTTERDDLSVTDWLRHMQQEMLDGAVYAEAAIKRIADLEAERAALMSENAALKG